MQREARLSLSTCQHRPPQPSPVPSLLGPPVPPAQRVYFYSPDEWEIFITRWLPASPLVPPNQAVWWPRRPAALTLQPSRQIAATKTHGTATRRLRRPAEISDAIPEILKIFRGAAEKHYVLPDKYVFVAPRGCGSSLNRL